MWAFSALTFFRLMAVTARASASTVTHVMRSRTTTTRETTAGRRELLEGAVNVVWEIRMKGDVELVTVHYDTLYMQTCCFTCVCFCCFNNEHCMEKRKPYN